MKALTYTLLFAIGMTYIYAGWHDFIYGGDFKEAVIEVMVGAK